MVRSLVSPGACRKASTSEGVLNWGMRVSSFVLTSTVRDRVGSTCNTAGKQDGMLSSSNARRATKRQLTSTRMSVQLTYCVHTLGALTHTHTCMTVLRVVALFQSELSSRHRMMYSC